ncbi:MAG: DnaJ domain-containing protein [Synergistaceae bacterium]|nr:DnaJ domain-containing protein [Synergistaceae bacterium]
MLYRLNDKDFRPNNHNLYFLFGLHADATQDDIKAAFRRLTRKYHPDLHQGDSRFQYAYAVINNIYSILSNSRKRAEYNFFYRRHIMLWQNMYNPDDYRANKFPLIPAGNYRVRIEDAQETTSHAGNNMIKLTLAVSGYSSKLWYYLVLNDKTPEDIKKTNTRLGKIFDSFGIVEGNMHLSDWHGCVGGARIRHSKDNDGNDRAEIHYFLDRDKVETLPAWMQASSQGNIDPDMMDFPDSPNQQDIMPF